MDALPGFRAGADDRSVGKERITLARCDCDRLVHPRPQLDPVDRVDLER